MPLEWKDHLTYRLADDKVWFVNGQAMYIMLNGAGLYSVAYLEGRELATLGPFPTFEAAKAVAELNKK